MNDLNEVIIEGKLTKNPELRWIKENEKAVCKFTVAVNKYYKDKVKDEWVQDTSFFLVEAWKGMAINCSRFLHTGDGVRVVGELKQSVWKDDANGGKARERIYIIAEHIEFQSQKKSPDSPSSVKTDADNTDSKDARDELDKEALAAEDVVEEVLAENAG